MVQGRGATLAIKNGTLTVMKRPTSISHGISERLKSWRRLANWSNSEMWRGQESKDAGHT